MNAALSDRPLWNVLDWNSLDAAQRAQALRRPAQASSAETAAAVRAILEQVRRGGDAALRELARRFDGFAPEAFAVSAEEFDAAERALPASLRAAIDEAAERIARFHEAGAGAPYALDTAPGVRCERVLRPIRRVGLYVPAGSAPLPSTALMLGVPARLAGCPQIALCTPPRGDGSADPAVLYAARRCGIARAFKLGGAQAIAAMAFGTASVPKCDKLFGPGNAYVTEAKRQIAQREDGAAIDMPAGPSEVLVIADAGADPAFVAADLLSQAEHGPDSQALLLSDEPALIACVGRELERQLEALPRAAIARRALAASSAIRVASIEQALAISNDYAPEHLILALRDARAWLPKVAAAGSVFLGDWAPEALGDYCSGTNHVLPTSGAARFVGGLNVASFQVAITVQEVSPAGLAAIGPCAIELAEAEGLHAHREAVALRLRAASARRGA
ncbi:histidinol dehydrogenase [Vulcaniibacterium tengchongense]|uniref:Histidinol dehydrogenase n=1 Tax=Vulcaniibacterium tengchongense TaxID=1273429 RepID=A0A3N4VQ40_9GAMM|nr:histidinol dehydrogenase [Vulcaniibacterium tengchongense]RPE82009.1 histidinol dehydrogenase [Vulcaniibacterium tengchongense]